MTQGAAIGAIRIAVVAVLIWRRKSSTGPARVTVSRKTRVPSVRSDLKEARAKHWPDEQKSHMRRPCWVRRLISSKPDTCTENTVVDAAGISVKVASYPERSANLACY